MIGLILCISQFSHEYDSIKVNLVLSGMKNIIKFRPRLPQSKVTWCLVPTSASYAACEHKHLDKTYTFVPLLANEGVTVQLTY